MTITYALVLFFLFMLIYLLIIEIFTVLFRLTGLTYDKANLQVISMLTNCGFTTKESEAIATFPIRRKLAKITIVFGYLFTVIIMSSIVNIFFSLSNSAVENMWQSIIVTFLFTALITVLVRSRIFRYVLDSGIEAIGNRIMFGDGSNPIILLDMFDENAMCEITLTKMPPQFDGVMLKNSGLKEKYKIQVILIKRGGKTLSILDGEDQIKANDIIVVFGNYTNIKALFKKPATGAK